MDKTPGQAAFDAYYPDAANGEWNMVSDDERRAWEGIAQAAIDAYESAPCKDCEDSCVEICLRHYRGRLLDNQRATITALTAERDAYKEAIAAEKRNHCETARVLTAERDHLRATVASLKSVIQQAIDWRAADFGDAWEGEGEPPDQTPNGGEYDDVATRWWRAIKDIKS